MTLARPDVLYMHPLPADRGNEVTDEVIDGPNSVVYQEAENRLHTAKAIMALTMADPRSNMRLGSPAVSGGAPCLKLWSSRWAAMPSRGPASRGRFPSSSNTRRRRWTTSCPLFRSDARIVITHGNGPQIGNILIRVEEGERRVPRLPLDTCVSDSQGGMGYMIQRLACELFRREGIDRTAATVITQVLVSEGDPDMVHPSKPIGAFYSTERDGRSPAGAASLGARRNRARPLAPRGGVAASAAHPGRGRHRVPACRRASW